MKAGSGITGCSAEIDPALANTALTAANATLQNITSQRALKQAQLVLAQAQKDRNDKLFAAGVISSSDRDVAKANFDVATDEVASVAAQMKEAAAAVETAKANLGYTKSRRPWPAKWFPSPPGRTNDQREPAGPEHPADCRHQHHDGLGASLGSGHCPRHARPGRISPC